MQPTVVMGYATDVMIDQQTFFKSLGSRIAELRKEQGCSQAELGKRIGLSQQMIADYESGQKHHVPLCRIIDLAEALGVDLNDLLMNGNGKGKRGPSSKMERQIDQVRRLPKAKQRFVSELLENVLK